MNTYFPAAFYLDQLVIYNRIIITKDIKMLNEALVQITHCNNAIAATGLWFFLNF